MRDHLGRLDLDAAPRAEGEARVVGVHGVSEGELDIADGRRAPTGEDKIALRADGAQIEVVVEAPRLHDRRHEEDEQLGAEQVALLDADNRVDHLLHATHLELDLDRRMQLSLIHI